MDLDEALDRIEKLEARQQELLRDFARVTQQMPFADEVNQVPTLIAQVGTLKAANLQLKDANAQLQIERDAMRDVMLKATVIDMPKMRSACNLVVMAFEAHETDFGHHPDDDDVDCPEDDTCRCPGPAAINACAKAIRP